MTLAAAVKHHAPGRMRLRLVGPKSTDKIFNETVNSISKTHAVRRAEGNLVNRSILIEAEDEISLQSALNALTQNEIIEVQREPNPDLAKRIYTIKNDLDGFITDVTSGGLNLRKFSAILLMGLGAKQFVDGRFLPAGLSLIFYSLEILNLPASPAATKR